MGCNCKLLGEERLLLTHDCSFVASDCGINLDLEKCHYARQSSRELGSASLAQYSETKLGSGKVNLQSTTGTCQRSGIVLCSQLSHRQPHLNPYRRLLEDWRTRLTQAENRTERRTSDQAQCHGP